MIINKIKRKIWGEINYARNIGVTVGKGCEFYKNITWGSEPYLISIGDNVRITSGCKFITHDGGVWVIRNLYNDKEVDKFGKITIGNNVHIGWDTIIMPGVTIGDNVIIGCGAIVTKDIPNNSVYAGVPAKKIKDIETYYEDNKGKMVKTKKMSRIEKKDFLNNYFKEDINEW